MTFLQFYVKILKLSKSAWSPPYVFFRAFGAKGGGYSRDSPPFPTPLHTGNDFLIYGSDYITSLL